VLRVGIVGASGYIGGELLRILLGHPRVEVVAATSTRLAGRPVSGAHPNLRGLTGLAFTDPDALPETDALFLATPHTETMGRMARWGGLAKQVYDLSADFRLRDPARYDHHYGLAHQAPERLRDFVYGLPELHREELRDADRVAVPGCMATAAILALHPLVTEDLVHGTATVDARTGSSGTGATAGPENLHAERSGAMRVFAPERHRHQAEIAQETGLRVRMSATGVEAVRGVQVLCRVTLAPGVDERDLRAAYRRAYAGEPFVRVVAQKRGAYRLPEPKLLAGSNFCDVGFSVDPDGTCAVLVAALDNLVKGGAGNAVQCMNLRFGWPERTGLEFPGLHPC
jgi:N-acetyl-gamma-glutamyl-phosphate/LysW-gamma-L-alpha-aminoadipyl-6-phosphate reductase